MSLQLIVMRHAKSSWGTPANTDHARPLNGRGRRAATALGTWLADRNLVPGQVLSSDSQRTRETWAGMAPAFQTSPTVQWRSDLYHASPETMLDLVRTATSQTVMILGHNPGCAELALRLVGTAPNHPRFVDYPTAATLVARFAVSSWSDVSWGNGTPVDFVIPADLGVS